MGYYALEFKWTDCSRSAQVSSVGHISVRVVCTSERGHMVGRDTRGLYRVRVGPTPLMRGCGGKYGKRFVAWFKNLRSAQAAAEAAE